MLAAAVGRARWFRSVTRFSVGGPGLALLAVGRTPTTVAPVSVGRAVQSDRDQAIVARFAGRELIEQHMVEILIHAGESECSASARMSRRIRWCIARGSIDTGSDHPRAEPFEDQDRQYT